MENGASETKTFTVPADTTQFHIRYKITIYKVSGEEVKPPALKQFDEGSSGQPTQTQITNPPPLKQFVP